MFGYVVLIFMVGISVCQNCISGLPFSVCCGCSVSKKMENVLGRWLLWKASEEYGFDGCLQFFRV